MHNPNRRSFSQLVTDLGMQGELGLIPMKRPSNGNRSLAEKKLRRAKRKQKRN